MFYLYTEDSSDIGTFIIDLFIHFFPFLMVIWALIENMNNIFHTKHITKFTDSVTQR